MKQSLHQALDFVAGRSRAIDLKLRLALRVAALAAACFLAVAAYALFDSDRAARAKVSHIAEIVAKDISLQQAQAHWFSLPAERTPDLQRVAAPLMEPGLCIAYQDKAGAFRQGFCSGALADEIAAPESYAALYRAIFHPGEPISRPLLIEGAMGGVAVATFDPAVQIGQSWREASRLLSIMAFALAGLCLAVYAALARALRPTHVIQHRTEAACRERSFRSPAQFRSRRAFGDFRRLQRACAETGGRARRTQCADAKADRRAGRGAAPSCARVARRIRSVAHRDRGASRRGGAYGGAPMSAASRRMPRHLAHHGGLDGHAARSAGAPASARHRGTRPRAQPGKPRCELERLREGPHAI